MKTSILAILILFHIGCYSQGDWTNISVSNGLTANTVRSFAFDTSNNIWIGMGSGSIGNGIDKYDGDSWTNYNTNNSQIPSDAINEIKIDQDDNLWVSFYGGFTSSIRKLTKFDGVNWVVFDTTNSNISSNEIIDIQIDDQNNIWTSSNEGFSKYDGTTFTNYQLDIFPGVFIVENPASIWCSYRLEIGGAFQGLAHYNPITGVIDLFNQNNSNIPSYLISAIELDSSGIVILGFNFAFQYGGGISNGGIALFDGNSFNPMMPFYSQYPGVYDLKISNDNNLWVSTRCEGLYKYDWQSWTQIMGPPLDGCSVKIEQDQVGNMWFGELESGAWTNGSVILNTTLELNSITIDVYPNPANLFIQVNHENIIDAKFNLYNSIGKLIMYENLNSSTFKTQISTENCNNGLYYWKIEQNGIVLKSGKVIITE